MRRPRIIPYILAATSAVIFAEPATACTTAEFKCSLQADSTPSDQPWNDPARFAYTFNNNGKDSYSIDVTGKAVFDLRLALPVFALAELNWHKNNQQKKEQSSIQAAGGLHFEFDNTPSDRPITSRSRLFSIFVDAKVGYNRKAIFADKSKPVCVADPDAVICNTQYLESVRGTLDVSPFFGFFESAQKRKPTASEQQSEGKFEGPSVAHSFGIVGTLFRDNILDNKVDPATGDSIRGAVSGVRGRASIALSPKFANYRLVFRGSGLITRTLGRADGREADFGRSTHLVTASLDYDLGRSSLIKGDPVFRPAVGITYTDGSDPLTGRLDQSTIVVGLKLSFK